MCSDLSLALVTTPPSPVVEHVRKELAQVITLDTDNLSAVKRHASMAKEPAIFVSRGEVKALV